MQTQREKPPLKTHDLIHFQGRPVLAAGRAVVRRGKATGLAWGGGAARESLVGMQEGSEAEKIGGTLDVIHV